MSLKNEIAHSPVPIRQVKSIKAFFEDTPYETKFHETTMGCFVSHLHNGKLEHVILLRKKANKDLKLFVLLHEMGHYAHRKKKCTEAKAEYYATVYAIKKCIEKKYYSALYKGMGLISFLSQGKEVASHDMNGARMVMKTKVFKKTTELLKKW